MFALRVTKSALQSAYVLAYFSALASPGDLCSFPPVFLHVALSATYLFDLFVANPGRACRAFHVHGHAYALSANMCIWTRCFMHWVWGFMHWVSTNIGPAGVARRNGARHGARRP